MEQVRRKTVVITGSTRGIGKAIALRLVRQHYNVVLNYASDDIKAQETLSLCQQETPYVLLVKADVSNKQAVETLMQESTRVFHSLDVLINNAARAIDKPLRELTEEDWDQVIDTNMKGVFLCSQIASTYMLQQEDGGIILNIGASTGIRGRRNGINTCASKAGLMIMTHCLALELGPRIRVNTIIPGLVVTEETEQRSGLHDPAVRRQRELAVPLQRLGQPDDIAYFVMDTLATET